MASHFQNVSYTYYSENSPKWGLYYDYASKNLPLPIAHHLWLSRYKVLLDSDKYLLSYSTLINPHKPDGPPHDITDFINFD